MELRDFIDQTGQIPLAQRLGCTTKAISHWRCGRRRPSPRYARELELVSGGLVRAVDIRPDIFAGLGADRIDDPKA